VRNSVGVARKAQPAPIHLKKVPVRRPVRTVAGQTASRSRQFVLPNVLKRKRTNLVSVTASTGFRNCLSSQKSELAFMRIVTASAGQTLAFKNSVPTPKTSHLIHNAFVTSGAKLLLGLLMKEKTIGLMRVVASGAPTGSNR